MTQAIIDYAGHQYFVSEGDTLTVDKHIDAEKGKNISVDQVLLVMVDGKTTIGTPTVKGASVDLKIETLGKGSKLHIMRFRAKSRHRRKIGHRQPQTTLTVNKINLK